MVRPNAKSYFNSMQFFYVYVLKSIHKDFIYVGFTHNLRKRFPEHNNGEELSTKAYAPFDLIFYEAYRNEKDAKRREEYFKTTKGKVTLKQMLKEYFKESKKNCNKK
jgi:putative endonuclease